MEDFNKEMQKILGSQGGFGGPPPDLSNDNDEDLLRELEELVGEEETFKPTSVKTEKKQQSIIDERIRNYKLAIEQPDLPSMKLRRYKRQLGQLEEWKKKEMRGISISPEELPAPIILKNQQTQQHENISDDENNFEEHLQTTTTTTENEELERNVRNDDNALEKAIELCDKYREASEKCKSEGDESRSNIYFSIHQKLMKMLEEKGPGIQISDLPPQLPNLEKKEGKKEEKSIVPMKPSPKIEPVSIPVSVPVVEESKIEEDVDQSSLTFEEALLFRKNEYEKMKKKTDDSRKMRRYNRLVGQYDEAIRSYKNKRPFDYNSLPTLPNFHDLPSPTRSNKQIPSMNNETGSIQAITDNVPGNMSKSVPMRTSPQAMKMLKVLEIRRNQYKKCAIDAKSKHNKSLAIDYLRTVKRIEQMESMVNRGLKINVKDVPSAPRSPSSSSTKRNIPIHQEKRMEGEIVPIKIEGDDHAILKKLIGDAKEQLNLVLEQLANCRRCKYESLIPFYEHLVQKGEVILKVLKTLYRKNHSPPPYQYEKRSFSILKSNPDLAADQLELTVIRGLRYRLPEGYSHSDAFDTWPHHTFPYPSDEKQEGDGKKARGVEPDYNDSFKILINTRDRRFSRIIAVRNAQISINYKPGIFRSERSIGIANIPLKSLESNATVEDVYDLMNGRRPTGAQLQVRMRVREPLDLMTSMTTLTAARNAATVDPSQLFYEKDILWLSISHY
ncbi:hypothetical protein SNEBB_008059 [Seison nebaliae]|nr:hypothetical protein SNEBB_008059 [Seison nebaliae]